MANTVSFEDFLTGNASDKEQRSRPDKELLKKLSRQAGMEVDIDLAVHWLRGKITLTGRMMSLIAERQACHAHIRVESRNGNAIIPGKQGHLELAGHASELATSVAIVAGTILRTTIEAVARTPNASTVTSTVFLVTADEETCVAKFLILHNLLVYEEL